ncbi:hypothetical protein KDK95_15730 [Actinospica sp. MGRD01-02]|uniref:DUF5709 domain-containing protein n=1 Tax=Actinospica acidithermotolerans TaxID=2828514 RepID=A0A941EEV3_9ACTN|nr:DUF5709 domain-containing protein [Actinospica acidithermotolerans]MBR7827769.1 hypothetical protein [Actinospica acidithermotolerans]
MTETSDYQYDEYTYDDPEDDGVLEPADDLSTDDYEDDPLDTGIEPPDHYGASNWYGVTEAEARAGESLDQLLAEEEPEIDADAPDVVDDRWADGPGPRSGRLVSDGRLMAEDVGTDAYAAGAEEAAVHLMDNGEIRYHSMHEED